jgi:hypothetical protein
MTQRTVRIVTGIGLVLLALVAIGFVLQSMGSVSFPCSEMWPASEAFLYKNFPLREDPCSFAARYMSEAPWHPTGD